MEDKHLMELDESFQNILLSTIRVPKNLHSMTESLPKANYTPAKLQKVDKHKFLNTIAGYKEREPYDDRLDRYYDENNTTKLPPIKEGPQAREITQRPVKEEAPLKQPTKSHRIVPAIEIEAQKQSDLLSIKKTIEVRKLKEKALREIKQKEVESQSKEHAKDLLSNLSGTDYEITKDTEPASKDLSRALPEIKEKESESSKKLPTDSPQQKKMELLNSYKVHHPLNNLHPTEKIHLHKPGPPLRSLDKRLENVISPSAAQEKKHPSYSIHDLNKDVTFDKHLLQIQYIYGVRPTKKLGVDIVPQKSIENKKQLKKEDYDIHNHRNLKLPSLIQPGVDTYPANRLPPQKNDANPTPNISQEKIKELSKVYRVRLGANGNSGDKYQNILKSNYKRENLSKNSSTGNYYEYLDNHMIAKKNINK